MSDIVSERQLPPSWDGSVVLDIGGDVGALVLHVPSTMDGREIDLDPEDSTSPHTHSAVRERRFQGRTMYAAVYPSLTAGRYVVEGTEQTVTIRGGEVTELNYVVE
jgi:hypothetical protein